MLQEWAFIPIFSLSVQQGVEQPSLLASQFDVFELNLQFALFISTFGPPIGSFSGNSFSIAAQVLAFTTILSPAKFEQTELNGTK